MLEGAGLFAAIYLIGLVVVILFKVTWFIVTIPFRILRAIYRHQKRRRIARYVPVSRPQIQDWSESDPLTPTPRTTQIRPNKGPDWVWPQGQPIKKESNLWPPPKVTPSQF
jgi:hypothetical protein